MTKKDTEITYNLENILLIVYEGFAPSSSLKYKKSKKLFGLTIRKEGIYDMFGDRCCDATFSDCQEIASKHILKEGIVYTKPTVTIVLSTNLSKTHVFDTEEEARIFMDECKSHKWILAKDH